MGGSVKIGGRCGADDGDVDDDGSVWSKDGEIRTETRVNRGWQ